jgi:N-hydroxyarylamine O-acetyltransferase
MHNPKAIVHDTTMTALDLDAYFDRIAFGGTTSPTYDTLAGVLLAHMSAIPFENVDVILGRGIRLDLDGLQAKLVTARRGGYCFEHASLFAEVLERLGFEPVRHLARVIVLAPRHVAPRTHMFLAVPIGAAAYLVDPGFGALAPRIPVPVADRREATIDQEIHWLERDGIHWTMRMRTPDRTADCWVTTLETESAADFAIANHYTATHPDSPFVNRIMLRALTRDGRVTLHNRDVTVISGGRSESSRLADRTALRALLAAHFGFDLPEVERMRVPTIPEWA